MLPTGETSIVVVMSAEVFFPCECFMCVFCRRSRQRPDLIFEGFFFFFFCRTAFKYLNLDFWSTVQRGISASCDCFLLLSWQKPGMDVADGYVTFVRHSQDMLREKVNEEVYTERLFEVSFFRKL